MAKNAINRPFIILFLLGAMFAWVSGAWAMEFGSVDGGGFPQRLEMRGVSSAHLR